jgi:mono/diheme cytochrome c family protein
MQRWLVLPDSARIGFSPTGEFKWPGGTVFIQHFEMVTNQATGARRRLETRLLVLDATGIFGYGATYRWRADNSDADLVDAGGQDEVLKITDASGATREQTWSYPARGLCFMCHTPNAGFVLGPKTRQLNGDHAYPGGRSDNQLRTWSYLQMFSAPVQESEIRGYARTCKIDDGTALLEDRVRSYLDVNCAACHRPGGTGALWDGRFDTPLAKQNIINGELRDTMGIANAKIVSPGDPARSMMHVRMASTTVGPQMPPLTRNVVDTVALDVLSQWIRANAEAP